MSVKGVKLLHITLWGQTMRASLVSLARCMMMHQRYAGLMYTCMVQTLPVLFDGGGVHDEGGVHEEFVSATTTTRLSEACMGTAGAADTTTATLVGTMGMLDGSTAQSHTATSPGLGKPSSLEPVGISSNLGKHEGGTSLATTSFKF